MKKAQFFFLLIFKVTWFLWTFDFSSDFLPFFFSFLPCSAEEPLMGRRSLAPGNRNERNNSSWVGGAVVRELDGLDAISLKNNYNSSFLLETLFASLCKDENGKVMKSKYCKLASHAG